MRKYFFIIASVIIVLFFIFVFAGDIKETRIFQATILSDLMGHGRDLSSGGKINIAACPTFHYMLDKLDNSQSVQTIKTQSTKESLSLLIRGKADLIISGRALKPEEPNFLYKKIGPGYDFVYNKELFILEEEMQFIPFYTDLSLDKIIADFNFISEKNLIKTENVYDFLDKGAVITSLAGEMEGEVIHIFQKKGERLRLSRLPRLYYSSDFNDEKINFITEIIKEN